MPNLKRPSYPNGLPDSTENRLGRRVFRSNEPILPPTPPEQRFRPVSALRLYRFLYKLAFLLIVRRWY